MKLYGTFIAALVSVGLIISVTSAQQKIDYTEMVEDIEVMCRIIDKTMKETFEDKYHNAGFFGRHGCQGFYLKGYGVVFLLNLQFPVAEKEIKVLKKEKSTNLWDKYEREIRRQPGLQESELVTEKNKAYDEDQVDKLKAELARLVGEYGTRIGQLEPDDMVSIVISGSSGHPGIFVQNGTGHLDFHVNQWWTHGSESRLFHQEVELDDGKKIIIESDDNNVIVQEKIIGNDEMVTTPEAPPKPKVKKPVVTVPGASTPVIANFGFHGKATTTMILTFNRSLLRNRTGADWETLLKNADIVQY